jgi:hypothetical protein
MRFLFSLFRVMGLYMFRALLAHPQETLHKLHLVYCVRVMSPEDKQVMLETCKGKGKAVPLQALTGPEGSSSLRLPDFKTIGT